jgi:hypothetical protein
LRIGGIEGQRAETASEPKKTAPRWTGRMRLPFTPGPWRVTAEIRGGAATHLILITTRERECKSRMSRSDQQVRSRRFGGFADRSTSGQIHPRGGISLALCRRRTRL